MREGQFDRGTSVQGQEYIEERQSNSRRDNVAPERVMQKLEGLMRFLRGSARVFLWGRESNSSSYRLLSKGGSL